MADKEKTEALPTDGEPADKNPEENQEAEKKGEELGGRMTFIEHLEELRQRIIISLLTVAATFLVIYSTDEVKTIEGYFMKPLRDVVKKYGSFQYTSMTEGFMFDVKIALISAIFVSIPMLFYQLWAFVAPGLYKKERRYVGPFIIASTVSFAAGAAFFYFLVFPLGAQFFASFAESEWIQFNPKLSETFSFVVMMVFAFGFVFEIPLITFILARLGIINVGFLNKNRKYAVLIIFVLAAIFTPPDVVSQLLLAGPMWALFEISVLITWIFGPRKKKPAEEAA
ncbi:MAG TPA: twin-arginine translocase subunit TatC [bacterium]|nr:twin-arginine translocase subunit TatC [bacterium]